MSFHWKKKLWKGWKYSHTRHIIIKCEGSVRTLYTKRRSRKLPERKEKQNRSNKGSEIRNASDFSTTRRQCNSMNQLSISHNKLTQNLTALNNNKHLYFYVAWDFRTRLDRWFWLRVFHELTRFVVIWKLDWGWWICFQDASLTHMAGKLILAVGKRSQFLTTWTSPKRCLKVLMTKQLAFLRKSNPKRAR